MHSIAVYNFANKLAFSLNSSPLPDDSSDDSVVGNLFSPSLDDGWASLEDFVLRDAFVYSNGMCNTKRIRIKRPNETD